MAPWTGRVRHGRFTFGGVDYQLPLNKPPHAIHGTVRDHEWTVESGAGCERLDRDPVASARRPVAVRRPRDNALRAHRRRAAPDLRDPCRGRARCPRSAGGTRGGAATRAVVNRSRSSCTRGRCTGATTKASRRASWSRSHRRRGTTASPTSARPRRFSTGPARRRSRSRRTARASSFSPNPSAAICVEPESGPPDQFNLSPRVVRPGEPLVARRTTWRSDPALVQATAYVRRRRRPSTRGRSAASCSQ